jgi:hypothetical protein
VTESLPKKFVLWVWGESSYFFEMTRRYKLRRKKPKSVFQDRPQEEHPSLT